MTETRNEGKSGRTTRLVDEYIQRFFNEPMYTPIVVENHNVNGEKAPYSSNVELLSKIERRLKAEHPNSMWYSTIAANMCPSDYSYGYFRNKKQQFNDIYKTCVIIRTNDPIMETRKTQLSMYREFGLYEINTYGEKIQPSLFDTMLVGRAKGYSTRLADKYVQDYFSIEPGDYIEIIDHYDAEGSYRAHERLCRVICRRLEEEHVEKFYVHKNGKYPRIIKIENNK